jgi:filamentous hemagglutinin family protein
MAPHGRLGRLGALATAGAGVDGSVAALADVATDGTLGAGEAHRQNVEVGADLGQIRGRNLFHSFERFDVERGGRVTFTGPSGLDNVVSRVTGGEPSKIDGTLASRVPGADVYLVNPGGIVFGPGARLDIPGSFHASTADELRFSDGVAFSAADPGRGGLSVARPEAFGFLGGGRPPGAITVDRGVLEVPAGEVLSLVGGDVTVTGEPGSASAGAAQLGILWAPGGRLALSALGGGPGAAAVVTGELTDGAAVGRLRLAGRALVASSGDGGGVVRARAGALLLEGGARVVADNTGAADAAGGVVIEAGSVEVGPGSAVTADALGTGTGGAVAVEAGRLLITGALGLGAASGLTSNARPGSAGHAGRVTVRAAEVEIRGGGAEVGGGAIASTTFGAGDGGAVTVDAGRLLVEFAPGVRSDAEVGSTGDAGRVTVRAGELVVRDGGQISSTTFAPGDAGAIAIEARRLLVAGALPGLVSGIGSAVFGFGGSGKGGTTSVRADEIELRDGGVIANSTLGSGDAGAVRIEAGRLLIADGLANVTGVGSTVETTVAGVVFGPGTGSAGTVTVQAREIEVRDGGLITSSTISRDGGAAGDVTVRASRLVVADGGEISSSGLGVGQAGDVRVEAGTLLVDHAGVRTVGADTAGGRIEVTAGALALLDGAEVTSNGVQPAAGTSLITIRAPLIVLLDDSRVTSLTGDGTPFTGSGEARLLGDLSFISEDSLVAGSSTVELGGVDNTVGTGLRLSPGTFLDAGALLGQACAAGRGGKASTFARAGRGGLPPSPDRPLASGGTGERDRTASAEGRRLVVAGTALSAECDGRPLAGAM